MDTEVSYGTKRFFISINHTERKSLAIEVHPDLSVKVIAPVGVGIREIRQRVLNKGKWIVKQQDYFQQFLPRTPQREYVPGETHYYLGKKYLLKLHKSNNNEVKLKGGELIVFLENKTDVDLIKKLLGNWYYKHSLNRFNQCISESVKKFKKYSLTEKPPLVIRRMSKRWGSCSPNGRIILNPEIIKTSTGCMRYVIIHELCHLVHPNHSKEFYKLQNEMMPDWEKWKLKLEKSLI
jgi:predicted metal-dependent hydrolase